MAFTPQTSVAASTSKAVNGLDADSGFGHIKSRVLTAACLPGRVVCGDHETAAPPTQASDVTTLKLGIVLYEPLSPPSSDGFADGYTVSIKAKGEAWAELLSGAAPTAGAAVYVYRGATVADRGKVTQDSGAANVTRLEGAQFTGETESGRAVVDQSGGTASAGTAAVASELASVANGQGASLIGLEDAGAFTSADDVEAALAELYQHLFSTVGGTVPLTLGAFNECTSAGAVGNNAALGGKLTSETTPVLGAETTTEAQCIIWAAANQDIIIQSVSLPADFDDTKDALLELEVRTDNAGGGGIEAATFTVLSTWSNGTQITDTATDSVPAETYHSVTATIAAADIPTGAKSVSIQLVPGTHANDPVRLLSARLKYQRKLLTS